MAEARRQIKHNIMTKHEKALSFITEIANANPIMQDIFLAGSCCNFYFILKAVFPEAKAHFNIDHVVTQIDDKYYDITGEINIIEVIKKGYMPISEIYSDKYKTDESIKEGEMYTLRHKTKYIRCKTNYITQE